MTNAPGDQPVGVPADGTPTAPSPDFSRWRDTGPMVPLLHRDGHVGLLVTRDEQARAVLGDPRFSQQPQRMPASGAAPVERVPAGAVDAEVEESGRVANILGSDGDAHLRLRRAVTKRFSSRSVRTRAERIEQIVAEAMESMIGSGSPADLTALYAEPISARVHALVLGVPDHLLSRFEHDYVHGAPKQQQHDLLREAIAHRREQPGEDVITDLLAADLTQAEVLGLIHTLAMSGRDTVAYFISTATVALLQDRSQLERLRSEPDRIPAALEEIVRHGTMFLTLFPRTATEDVVIDGRLIPSGTTVSVSAVSANRDERRWGVRAAELDVDRDAGGHLAFGEGAHMCVGQQLARAEIAVALRVLISTLPGLRLVHADQLTPQPLAHPVATYEAGSVVVAWG